MANWNPWHGCKKISPGCQNCYVYRMDQKFDRDSRKVVKTGDFSLPVARLRNGEYRISPAQTVYTCFTSDFFLDEADKWRADAWDMIKRRSDLNFFFITKRIDRFYECIPQDWGDGYENVGIGCTVENQDRADYRLPIFTEAPIKYRSIICEPLLEHVDIERYLGPGIGQVVVGGESGNMARICDYDWVLSLREQARRSGVEFYFKQTGAFFRKNGRVYRVPRRLQHEQAKKAAIDLPGRI